MSAAGAAALIRNMLRRERRRRAPMSAEDLMGMNIQHAQSAVESILRSRGVPEAEIEAGRQSFDDIISGRPRTYRWFRSGGAPRSQEPVKNSDGDPAKRLSQGSVRP